MGTTKRRIVRGVAAGAVWACLAVGGLAGAADGPMSGHARLMDVSVAASTVSFENANYWTCRVSSATVLVGAAGQRLELEDLVAASATRTAVYFEARAYGSSCQLEHLEIADGMPR